MKVLIVSHNVISETNNMGKTLLFYFKAFNPDEVAEFYIQEKYPTNASAAHYYYRITDREALKSIFGKRIGESFQLCESIPEGNDELKGAVESIRQYGRKKNAFVYIMRNAVWGLAHWKTKELREWLNQVNPDVLFFMAGDYSFMYKITYAIKMMIGKPLVICCVDDFYLFNRNESSVLGRIQHASFMKNVHKLMGETSFILTISDSMGEAYSNLFNKACFTLHTSAKKRVVTTQGERKSIAYFGNLSFRRFEQLVEIGKTIKRLGLEEIQYIDVYSGEKNPENMKGLTEENGVRFHGEISSSEVARIMDQCMAVIHTESFDQKIQNIIRYSVSTKIADLLQNGPCIIAYGPEGIASIDYLKKNRAAYVITNSDDLERGLHEIIANKQKRIEIVNNARELAAKNHDENINPKKVREWLQTAVEGSDIGVKP